MLVVVGLPGCARHRGEAAGALVSDPALCSGCARCALTCSALNLGGPSGTSALVGPDAALVAAQEAGDIRTGAGGCRQCPEVEGRAGLVEPLCVASCPTGAARIARGGHPDYGDSRVRYVEASECIGCGSCAASCPHDHPLLHEGRFHKCDWCLGRHEHPPCVDACPSSALVWVPAWTEDPPRPFPWEG